MQTDRLSAFDVILPTPIPGKGRVLTALSNFWFDRLQHSVPNHLTGLAPESVVKGADERAQVAGRAMVVNKYRPLLVEAVVRGYVAGSGWKDYQGTGSICGIHLPAGLQQAQKLPQPIFTAASKAPAGQHDENISFDIVEQTVGKAHAAQVRDLAIELYTEAAAYAETRGVIIADTKFEFGVDSAGKLFLIDEALTPDSSRFWPADQYRTGISPPSFDKQFVRDWLETQPWNKKGARACAAARDSRQDFREVPGSAASADGQLTVGRRSGWPPILLPPPSLRCVRAASLRFPTETVYGLGCDASNPAAIRRLYAAKGRPADHPVIVHLADASQVQAWAREISRRRTATGRALLARAAPRSSSRSKPTSCLSLPAARTASACACRLILSRTRCSTHSAVASWRRLPINSAA